VAQHNITINTGGWSTSSPGPTTTQNVSADDTVVVTLNTNSNVSWSVHSNSNCTRTPTSGNSGTACTMGFSATGAYYLTFSHSVPSGKSSTTYYTKIAGTVGGSTPTLTAVDITPATDTMSGDDTQAFAASITGTASDVVYAWSLTGDTDNASLSGTSGTPVTVTTTDDADTAQETVTVNVSATSSEASVSSGVTDTAVITLNHTSIPNGGVVGTGSLLGGEFQRGAEGTGEGSLLGGEFQRGGELLSFEIARTSYQVQNWS
jgi:hypothetical protein